MNIGKLLQQLGLFLILFGAVITNFPKSITWFGRLPGDFQIKREKSVIKLPIASLIILGLLLVIGVNMVDKYLWKI